MRRHVVGLVAAAKTIPMGSVKVDGHARKTSGVQIQPPLYAIRGCARLKLMHDRRHSNPHCSNFHFIFAAAGWSRDTQSVCCLLSRKSPLVIGALSTDLQCVLGFSSFGLIFSSLFALFAEINQQILTNYVSTLDADFEKS
jgi:hypothetical protein